ncbi:C-type lectin domain family 9 member A-like [Scomber japonicus]|uniref:C-type lectin domain family 9 member A-like n=1 Tax=Scomber japonicus TaxID=13676 RepID=UPI0023065126|nr:C-type lectin domain family 9 member A-like [Scomber japonicus]
MDLDEEIYINIEELRDTISTKHKGPENNETKHVRADFVAGDETETCSSYKVATVCVGLLCFVLLTTVIAVSVQYDKDYNQLSRDLANHTAENEQLLLRYHNLTEERDHLKDTFKSTELKLDNAMKKIGSCPDGWSLFGCSCYYLSREVATWDNSRQQCLKRGADLVIINSQKEMVFLNKFGTLKFWIGLRRLSGQSNWMWTDASSPRTT